MGLARLDFARSLISALLIIQGINYATSAEDFLEKCCNLGGSWAGQKLRCEKFTGPVPGVSPDEEAACLEAVDICCRKSFQELSCEEGKADAKAGLACTRQETGARRTPVGLGDYRRDCCEGCKLGILTGASGKGCASKKFSLGIPWDPAFAECCIESMTSVTQDSSTTTSTQNIDECSEGPITPCPFGSSCENTNGSYRCVRSSQKDRIGELCEIGYRWNSTLGRCSDVNECLENLHKCMIETENCKNLDGSYECEIKCETGFVFNGNYGVCLDINECIELSNVCPQVDTICINTLGSYECKGLREYQQLYESSLVENGTDDRRSNYYESIDEGGREMICAFGFEYNSDLKRCDDIDECRVHEQPCAPGETCRNTIGGYDCIPSGCPRGFSLVNDTCQDVNECELNQHSCAAHERCQNTNGSYTCEPPRPTRRPATTEAPSIICRKGYKVDSVLGRCVDVDECVEGPGCRDHERCHNLQGGYDCSPLCGPGWYFHFQTKTCQDVDECLIGQHNCRQRRQYCRNTNGSYVCEALTPCQSGYRRAYNGSCIDVDECQESLHSCNRETHRYCVNLNGSYECIVRLPPCPRGFEYSLLTSQCEDVDECRRGIAKCDTERYNERCVNLPGSYRCERPIPRAPKRRPACPAGLTYDVTLRRCSGKSAETVD